VSPTQQIVDQNQPAAGGDGKHFVDAVGIKSREGYFRWVFAMQVEPRLAALVPYDKLAPRGGRGQREHKRAEHARRFLGIAMAGKEAALIIDQKLVEFGGNRFAHPEAFGDAGDNRLQRPLPMLAADPHPIRGDLPGAPHGRIDDGIRAAAIGRALGNRDELLGLHRQQRQGHGTDALDLQPRRQEFHGAGGKKVPRPADRAKQFGKLSGDR
jgi:hypothetical protein